MVINYREMIIDKSEIEQRFKRSIDSYDENALAQKAIIERLMSLVEVYSLSNVDRILEVGCGTGLLTERLQHKFSHSKIFINDLVSAMCHRTADRCGLEISNCIPGDIESVALNEKYNLIISASTFQWLACPDETFARLANRLQPGGWMIFSTFGKDNFIELKSITKHGLVYHSISEISTLLSSYFNLLHAEENHYQLEFPHPLEILKHVKKTGVNATNASFIWTRRKLEQFTLEYTPFKLDNGNYPLTYHPQYFICRKPL